LSVKKVEALEKGNHVPHQNDELVEKASNIILVNNTDHLRHAEGSTGEETERNGDHKKVKLEHQIDEVRNDLNIQPESMPLPDEMSLNYMLDLATQDIGCTNEPSENNFGGIQLPLFDSSDSMTNIFEMLDHPSIEAS